VVSGEKVYFHFAWKNMISLVWSLRDDNETHVSGTWYGDSCMNPDAIRIHDDIILSVGWGDGFAVRRILDNGTFENIYYDNTPIGSTTNYNSLAIDKTNKKAYVGYYGADGAARYDYSECLGGDDSVVDEGVLTESSDDLPADRAGYAYHNGFEVVGDYLYQGDYSSVTNVKRWKISTETSETLTVNGYRNSAYRGRPFYDDIHNRLFIAWYENGEMWMVINPENASDDPTNPAKCYNLRFEEIGMGNDARTAMAIVDRYNPNHLYIAGYNGRFAKIDITPIVEETNPDPILLDSDPYKRTTSNYGPPFWMWGWSQMYVREHETIPNNRLMIIHGLADYYAEQGWFDYENWKPVGAPNIYSPSFYQDSTTSAVTWANEDILRMSYFPSPLLATSSGGNKYWIQSGYGWDGYKFRSWDYDDFPNGLCLETKGEIIFGTYSLDNNENVGEVVLSDIADQVYIPSGGCKLVCQVSNDNGVSWEKYDYMGEKNHIFKSTGYQIKVKFIFYGNIYNAPHINSSHYINVTLVEKNIISNRKTIARSNSLIGS